jgi:hypothetical protein
MSRSDGKFPSYVKLEIDPDQWPENYHDKARQCVGCAKLWPHPHLFDPSPCCDCETEVVEATPDMRWPDAVHHLLEARFNRWYEEYNDGLADEQLAWEEVITHGEIDAEKTKKAIESIEIPDRGSYKGVGH